MFDAVERRLEDVSGRCERNGNALRKIARYSAAGGKRSYQNKTNSFWS